MPDDDENKDSSAPDSGAPTSTELTTTDLRETVIRTRTPVFTTAPSSPVVTQSPRRSSISVIPFPVDTPTATYHRDLALSPSAQDRVFPIRSVVSRDASATPMARQESGDGFPGMSLPGSREQGGETRQMEGSAQSLRHRRQSSQSAGTRTSSAAPQSSTAETLRRRPMPDGPLAGNGGGQVPNTMDSLLNDNDSIRSESVADGTASVSSRPESFIALPSDAHLTARFKHVVTEGGHAIITGRDGQTLQRCEDEPIHIPGAIQSFGLLIVLKEEKSKLLVRVVSENSAQIIGYTPAQLFALSNFLDIFNEEQSDTFLDHLEYIREDGAADPLVSGPEVHMLSLRIPGKRTVKLWCAMHINDTDKEAIICEFELEDDKRNPLVHLGGGTPELPEDTLGSEPTTEELLESTTNASRPLRVLRSARKKRGEAAAMEVFNVMAQIQEQLASAPTLEIFLKILIGVIKELTGFHRVMMYQFDADFNGRVVAELLDPRATKDLYMGLNFPASDIPKQARDLYRMNKVRLLYDREQETARLVCRTLDDLAKPLDMTFSYLRAMSPIHVKYLRNMAVRSSMSISITAFDELWGLISCHGYGGSGMRVSFPIRKMCRLVGDTASRNIERLSYASRLQARKLINTACTRDNPSGYIVASSDDLLDLFSADCGALCIREETKLLGRCDGHLQEVLAMIEFLRLSRIESVFTSIDIQSDFPDMRYPPGFKFLAGLLFVPLSNTGNDFIVFFRKGHLKEVKWAGNPYEKFVKEGTEGYLEPRKSFKTWSEVIVGKCREWTEQEAETASVLCLVYGKFIEVWRQKEVALENSQLQRLLLSNSAHEFRTPLNAIINYLEIAMEGTLDQDTRENLTKSHSASKSLVYVMNDLLDLTKTEQGLDLVKEESFDFLAMLKEATEPFQGDAHRKSLAYQVTADEKIPRQLIGDPRRVRQVISNVVANAIQNTSSGFVKVDVRQSPEQESMGKMELEFVVEDSGAGMSQQKVDELFRELEQVSQPTIETSDSTLIDQVAIGEPASPTGRESTLGLGLAIVARFVRNMNGQLRLKTEEGRGSRFVILLILGLPSKIAATAAFRHRSLSDSLQVAFNGGASNVQTEGEKLLIDRSPNKRVVSGPMSRTMSQESVTSIDKNSMAKSGTSAKSDVDRLIDDIQKPYLLSEAGLHTERRRPGSSSSKISRSNSLQNDRGLLIKSPDALTGADQVANVKVPGEEPVTDSRTPIKPLRLAGDLNEPGDGALKSSRVAFEIPPAIISPVDPKDRPFSILVAEDDPVNCKIMKKRLEKLGHRVHLTVNGEECASAFGNDSTSFDVVLMDIQMPIVDGFTSTKMIRSYEKVHASSCLSSRAALNGRIPIFAVSASLFEKERDKYLDIGLDGWILKPVDFKRMDLMIKGTIEKECRTDCLYHSGQWEKGGWFRERPETETDISTSNTRPSGEAPTTFTPERSLSLESTKIENG